MHPNSCSPNFPPLLLGFCCQRPKASVPWSAVRDAQDDFIESKFLPTGQKIKDPSKLQLAEADSLLQFWQERQKNKIWPTFEFKAWQDYEKEIREPVERFTTDKTAKSSSAGTSSEKSVRKPSERSAGKTTSQVEQESSSDGDSDYDEEDADADADGGEHGEGHDKEDEHEMDDNNEDDDDDDDDDDENEVNQVPPPRKTLKSTVAEKQHRVSPARSQSDDSLPPVKKSKTTYRSFGPTSGGRTGKKQIIPTDAPAPPAAKAANKQNIPADAPAPPAAKTTSKKAKGHQAEVPIPAPKRSNRSSKATYKVNYMHQE